SQALLSDILAIVNTPQADRSPFIVSGSGPSASISLAENATAVTTVAAVDPDNGAVLGYSIVGGADQLAFVINSSTGALSFVSAPNFENPTDNGHDNVYNVTVQVSDGSLVGTQDIAVSVTNVPDGVYVAGTGAPDLIDGTHTPSLQPFVTTAEDTI